MAVMRKMRYDGIGKIIIIGVMKDDAGKFVTASNLTYSLQKCGKKILAVDFVHHFNLTTCFGAEEKYFS